MALLYLIQPGFEFIREGPTVWEDTRVLDAKVNEYIVIARRKDDNWFVGSINNTTTRTLTIPFSFLPVGKYTATIFSDSTDVAIYPNHLIKKVLSIGSEDLLQINLAKGGGMAIELVKQ